MSAAALAPDRRARIQAAWDKRRFARIASAWDNRKLHGLDTGIFAPLPKRGTKGGEQIAWAFPDHLTRASDGSLARAFVAMGLTRRLLAAPRYATPLWYESRLPPAHGPSSDFSLDWPVFLMDNPFWFTAAHVKATNLALDALPAGVLGPASHAQVLRMAPDRHEVWVCTVSGDWITQSRGAKGRSFVSLGQYIWAVSEFEAARRLCRANGYRGVPRVGDLR